MRQDIRHAGLAPEIERRLRLAARTLALQGVDASVDRWEGIGCRLVVVGTDDAYGRHVLDIARRRQVPVIAVGTGQLPPDEPTLSLEASISDFASALQPLLRSSRESAPARAATVHALPSASDGLLQQLASDGQLGHQAVHARLGARSLYLLPERGRVLARTRSDLIELRDRLCQPGFEITRLGSESEVPADVEVSEGLDAYLLLAAVKGAARLPAFEDVPCELEHWPDLAAADGLAHALKVAAPLMRGAYRCRQISAATGVDAADVSTCFWAFSAAGILRRRSANAAAAVPSASSRAGLWSRLARRFGLS